MNVFLLYPDRDFASDQELPPQAGSLEKDLELGQLIKAMAGGDEFLAGAARQLIFASLSDTDEIAYRQQILQDCLRHPQLIRQLYGIPLQAIEKMPRHWMGILDHPSGILSDAHDRLEVFLDLLRQLKRMADEQAEVVSSAGLRRFFAMLQRELDEDYLDLIERHLDALEFKHGVLVSAQLGRGNIGRDYILHRVQRREKSWLSQLFDSSPSVYTYTLDRQDHQGARTLSQLRDKALYQVANALGQAADHIEGFLNRLQLESGFYLACLNLAEQLQQLNEPISFPQPQAAGQRRLAFTGLYDATLALTVQDKVVGNDLDASGKDLLVITGANQGGKSTFLRSLGVAQLMMQSGMFVPAERFSANLISGLFSHYKREEDADMVSGKFDEELSRVSTIVDQLQPNGMVLFNESFASTNEREGAEIARQITHALVERGVQVVFVTHLYAFAQGLFQEQMDNALFLRAERKPDGARSFKLVEGQPLQSSFGEDIYRQVFGIDADSEE